MSQNILLDFDDARLIQPRNGYACRSGSVIEGMVVVGYTQRMHFRMGQILGKMVMMVMIVLARDDRQFVDVTLGARVTPPGQRHRFGTLQAPRPPSRCNDLQPGFGGECSRPLRIKCKAHGFGIHMGQASNLKEYGPYLAKALRHGLILDNAHNTGHQRHFMHEKTPAL